MAKKYNEVTPEILEQFKAIVPGKVYAGEEINSDYFHDEMPIYGKGAPEVVIEATTTEEIAAIVKVCYENSLPVIPRGAGTGLTGAAVAVDGGVMIDMSKMNKILGYDLENFVVRVEPGVLLNDLAEDAQKQGLSYIRRIRVKSLRLSAEMFPRTQAACAPSNMDAQEIMCAP